MGVRSSNGGDDSGVGGKPGVSRVRVIEGDGVGGGEVGSGGGGGGVFDSESGRVEYPGGGSGVVGDVQSSVGDGGGSGVVLSLDRRTGSRVGGSDGPSHVVGLPRNEGAAVQGEVVEQFGRFEETAFTASVKTARVTVGGDLEITITVPITEKYLALKVTDAPGVMLVFNVKRKKRGE